MNKALFLYLFFIGLIPSLFAQKDYCDYKDKTAISAQRKVVKLYNKAEKLRQKKKKNEAIQVLEQALIIEDTCAKVLYKLASMYDRKNKIDKAYTYYTKVDSVCDTYHPNLYYKMGSIAHFKSKNVFAADPQLLNCAMHYSRFLEVEDPRKSKYHTAALRCRECMNLYELYADTVPFDPIKVEKVSQNKTDEYFPFLAPDNESLYFSRVGYEKPKGLDAGRSTKRFEKIMVRVSAEDTFDIVELDYPFNQEGISQGASTLSIDNQEMFLTVCLNKNFPNDLGIIGACDIYYSKKQGGYWQDFQNLNELSDFNINTSNFESMPSLSSDGNTLYFVSDRHDADLIKRYSQSGDQSIVEQIDFDIYFSTKLENGKWGKPKRLGPEINSPKNEKTPFIHPDNRTLYFSSEGHYGIGRYDVFFSRKDKEGTWEFAKNIGIPINTFEDNGDFMASLDGEYGFFASRPSGTEGWEVYQFPLHIDAKPKKLVFVKGDVESELGSSDATVKIRNNKTGEMEEIPVSDEGTFAYIAQIEEIEMDDEGDEIIKQNSPKHNNSESNSETKEAVKEKSLSQKEKNLIKLKEMQNKMKSKKEIEEIIKNQPIAIEDTLYESATSQEVSSTPPAKKMPVVTEDFDITVSAQQKGSFSASNTFSSKTVESGKVAKNKLAMPPINKGATFRIENLLFATDSYELNDRSKSELWVLIDFMKTNENVKIAIHGHTDNKGSALKNLTLSSDRANAVYQFLIDNGIDTSRLQYKGFGQNKPIDTNSTETGRAKNRRTEIVIL